MKKTLLLLAMLCGATLTTYAQSDNTATKLGAGFDIGATTGPASGAYPVSGGLILKAETPLEGTPVSLVFVTGYTFAVSSNGYQVDYYSDSDYDYSSGSLASFIPVQVGAKFYAADRIFIEGDVGASFYIGSTDGGYNGKKAALLLSPSAGYTIPFGQTRASLDLSLAYEDRLQTGGGFGQVALRGVFNFNL